MLTGVCVFISLSRSVRRLPVTGGVCSRVGGQMAEKEWNDSAAACLYLALAQHALAICNINAGTPHRATRIATSFTRDSGAAITCATYLWRSRLFAHH